MGGDTDAEALTPETRANTVIDDIQNPFLIIYIYFIYESLQAI
jgi:hypothetical protein